MIVRNVQQTASSNVLVVSGKDPFMNVSNFQKSIKCVINLNLLSNFFSIWARGKLFTSQKNWSRSNVGTSREWRPIKWWTQIVLHIDWTFELRENNFQRYYNVKVLLIISQNHTIRLYFVLNIDLQMKPYRTDEYVHKLFYETSRFTAFNHQWVVKARINNSQRDPHTVNDRRLTYQV